MGSRFVALIVLVACFTKTLAEDPTAYEVLASYGFPDGLLPRTVQNSGEDYVLNDNGTFELHLERPCRFTIPDSYEVRYSSKITGSIQSGQLHDLNGIAVHIFYVWWNINEINVVDNELEFKVGPFSASFPSENFDENPMCSGAGGSEGGHANQ